MIFLKAMRQSPRSEARNNDKLRPINRKDDAACFFTSNAKNGMQGIYAQPNEELGIRNFAISLHARAAAFAKLT